MHKKEKAQIKDLEDAIDKYMKSGKSISEFIKESMFNDYTKYGDKELKEIATEYFLDHLK